MGNAIAQAYTQAEQFMNRCKLIAALLSGNYAEGRERLRVNPESNAESRFCCLGVACDISGLGEWSSPLTGSSRREQEYLVTVDDAGKTETETSYLSPAVRDFYGFTEPTGAFTQEGINFINAWLTINGKSAGACSDLAQANDKEVPHAVLATMIAKGYVRTEDGTPTE